jgi:hypothetical protein
MKFKLVFWRIDVCDEGLLAHEDYLVHLALEINL